MRLALASFVAIASVAAVAQADIVYSINPFPGAPAITGQIVTDGTIGNITSANIVSWSYTTGSSTFSGTGLDTRFVNSAALTATATDLIFASSNPSAVDIFELYHTSGGFYADTLAWVAVSFDPYMLLDHRGLGVPNNEWFQVYLPNATSFVIATVPAPGAAALLGLAGLVATRRRR